MRVLTLLAIAALAIPGPAIARAADGVVPAAGFRHSAAEVDARLDAYWRALFAGDADARVYFERPATADGPSAIILDTGNGDVRSEGMSYGMAIAVAMGRKAEFDALWNWTATHMRYRDGPREGWFRWRCAADGCHDDPPPAPDGEQYLAAALLLASERWGDGTGLHAYRKQAEAILAAMLRADREPPHAAMFDRGADQVVFVPYGDSARFTDPSYHLPAFYTWWARIARSPANRARWEGIADASRAFFTRTAHPATALTPDYAAFDGRPEHVGDHGDFRFDAFRTAINWTMDALWWGSDRAAVTARNDRLLYFFWRQGIDRYPAAYRIDGTPLTAERSNALVAANAVAALVSTHPHRQDFIDALWRLDPPRGRWRYYDGMLQFLAMLHVSGRLRPDQAAARRSNAPAASAISAAMMSATGSSAVTIPTD